MGPAINKQCLTRERIAKDIDEITRANRLLATRCVDESLRLYLKDGEKILRCGGLRDAFRFPALGELAPLDELSWNCVVKQQTPLVAAMLIDVCRSRGWGGFLIKNDEKLNAGWLGLSFLDVPIIVDYEHYSLSESSEPMAFRIIVSLKMAVECNSTDY